MAGEARGAGGALLLELVLCTRNGSDRLERCLRTVRDSDQTHPFLVHIVDNGSTDPRSVEISRRFVAEFGPRARFSEEHVPGNSAGRNRALRELRGSHAVFIDDDCYLTPDCMAEWARVLRDSDHGYGGGTILPFDRSNSTLGCWEGGQAIDIAPRGFVKRGFIQGSNMFFSAACLRDIGLFDPRFGAGTAYAGEDWDMAIAASRAGWRGGYSSSRPSITIMVGAMTRPGGGCNSMTTAPARFMRTRACAARSARGTGDGQELRRLPAARRRAVLRGFADWLMRRDLR